MTRFYQFCLMPLMLCATVSSFSVGPAGPRPTVTASVYRMQQGTKSHLPPLAMFSGDGPPALEEDTGDVKQEKEDSVISKPLESTSVTNPEFSSIEDPTGLTAGGNLAFGSLGYVLFLLPVVLLLNDAFHFLPTEGPLAFLAKI